LKINKLNYGERGCFIVKRNIDEYIKKTEKIYKKRDLITKIISLLLPLLVMMTSLIIFDFYPGGGIHVEPSPTPSPFPNSVQEDINYLKNETIYIIDRLDKIEQSFNSISSDSDSILIYSELLELKGNVEDMSSELDNVETIILDNPNKALSTVLLSKELENIKSNYESDLLIVRSDIERVYRQNNWFIGLMFTIAIGLFTLSIRVINLNNEKDEKREE